MQGIGAGLSRNPQQPQQPLAPAPQGQQLGAPDMDGDEADPTAAAGEPASPEEQAIYDQFMENAHSVILGGGNQPSQVTMAHLQGQFEPELQQMFAQAQPPLNPQNPVDNLAATTTVIVIYLQGSAQEAGKDVPGYIVLEAGQDICDDLAQLVKINDHDAEMAFYRACDLYRQVSPYVDQNDLAQQFGQFVEADKSGQLERDVPGLKQKVEGSRNG